VRRAVSGAWSIHHQAELHGVEASSVTRSCRDGDGYRSAATSPSARTFDFDRGNAVLIAGPPPRPIRSTETPAHPLSRDHYTTQRLRRRIAFAVRRRCRIT
jgi:hypothetical protein